MRKTIFLKTDYVDIKSKKISRTEEDSLRASVFKKSVKQFKEQTNNSTIKIVQESLADTSIVIEFNSADWEGIYSTLLRAEVVEVIDSQIYKSV